MLEDKLLIWKFKNGSKDALRRIYEKYINDLLRLAAALVNDTSIAEDIVHEVFIAFVLSAGRFQLTGNLKSYLAVCVANRARNVNRANRRKQTAPLSAAAPMASDYKRPEQWIIASEELNRLNSALAQLPYEQREVILLHLQGGLRFTEIAGLQNVPIKTVQSRCRYGMDKLRSLLDSEAEK